MPRNTVRIPGVALALLALVTMLAPSAAWAGRGGIDPDGATMDGRGGVDPNGAPAKARAEIELDGAPVALSSFVLGRAGIDPNGRL